MWMRGDTDFLRRVYHTIEVAFVGMFSLSSTMYNYCNILDMHRVGAGGWMKAVILDRTPNVEPTYTDSHIPKDRYTTPYRYLTMWKHLNVYERRVTLRI